MKLNWNRIKALLDKEMIELWKNKIIVWTMIGIPLMMFLMTVGTMIAIMYLEGDKGDVKDFDKLNIAAEFKHLAPKIAMIVLLNEQYMFYYLMIPALLPVIIASHSIIGEKQIKSLEPLLATPITTSELLIGKSLAAVIIPVIAIWIAYGLTVLISLFTVPPDVLYYMARPTWLLGIGILSPVMAVLAVLMGIIISSRVNDPRVAQQIGGLLVLPLVGGSIVVLLGQLYITLLHMILTIVIFISLTLIVYIIAIDLFERENILTRWK